MNGALAATAAVPVPVVLMNLRLLIGFISSTSSEESYHQ
jgi:hypothetical protein